MRSYVSDAATILTANILSTLAGLGVQMCLAWQLLPEGRGQYAACILFATLLAFSLALGQEMANVYFLGSKKISISEAMTQSICIGWVVSVVSCACGYGLTFTSMSFLDKAPLSAFYLSLICIPAIIFQMYLTRIFLGIGEIKTFTLLTTIPRIIELLAILFFSLEKLDVHTVIIIHAISEGLVALSGLFILMFKHSARFVRFRKTQLRQMLSYGFRFYLGKLASMTNVQIGTIILAFSAVSVKELGLFAAASALGSRVWLIAESLQTALLPRTSADPTGNPRAVTQCVRVCLLCSAVITILLMVFTRPVIALLLSPRFLPVATPLQILLPGIWIRTVPKILTAYFNGIGKPEINSLSIGIAVTLNIVLIYFFLPVWSLAGVAWAMTIAYTVEAMILSVAFVKLSGQPARQLFLVQQSDIQKLFHLIRKPNSSNKESLHNGQE